MRRPPRIAPMPAIDPAAIWSIVALRSWVCIGMVKQGGVAWAQGGAPSRCGNRRVSICGTPTYRSSRVVGAVVHGQVPSSQERQRVPGGKPDVLSPSEVERLRARSRRCNTLSRRRIKKLTATGWHVPECHLSRAAHSLAARSPPHVPCVSSWSRASLACRPRSAHPPVRQWGSGSVRADTPPSRAWASQSHSGWEPRPRSACSCTLASHLRERRAVVSAHCEPVLSTPG